MNKTLGFGIVMILLLGGVGYYSWSNTRAKEVVPIVVVTPAVPPLSPEVEAVLADRMKLAIEITKMPHVLEAINEAGVANAQLSKEEIDKLDANWKNSKGTGPFVDKFLNNKGAADLKAFQVSHPEFKEIFVTDIYGLNVSQTNKTSDYLQSDESWWTDTFKDGQGSAHHGNIEFDESSQTEAIAIYLPMRDESGKIVGILKAVLDLSSIKRSI